jgi:hypothetical protein
MQAQPAIFDRKLMIHHAEIGAQVGLIFGKNGCCRHISRSSLTGGYPFEETPAGAFLSERF